MVNAHRCLRMSPSFIDPSEADMYDPLVNILEDDRIPIRVAKIFPDAIRLADGLEIPPNCAFLGGRIFEWSPPKLDHMKLMPNGAGWESWNDDVWALFETVSIKPGTYTLVTREILIFGTGDTVLPVPSRIRSHLHSLGVQVDVQNTVCMPS